MTANTADFMPGPPDTRYTLIARLPAVAVNDIDQAAWQEFVQAYEPFLYSFARGNGLQDTDARELVQQVLVSVAGSIQRWQPSEPGESRPRFRAWLRTIARNHLLNHLKSQSRQPGSGGTTNLRQLSELSEVPASSSDLIDAEFRKAAFRHCAAQVQREVKSDTWQAFWLTAVEGNSCHAVAQKLEMRVGSVYAARSRVIARMRSAVEAFWDDDDQTTLKANDSNRTQINYHIDRGGER
ncbi:MAG: sigma-70 family RNA polymerase sigma factor [Aureliella sp.]